MYQFDVRTLFRVRHPWTKHISWYEKLKEKRYNLIDKCHDRFMAVIEQSNAGLIGIKGIYIRVYCVCKGGLVVCVSVSCLCVLEEYTHIHTNKKYVT